MGSQEKSERNSRFVLISVSSGLFTGMLAGLVGLGGAEERIPFILYALRASVNDMIAANLVISFATSAVNFGLRARVGLFTSDALTIGVAMVLGSVAGAYLGSVVSHKLSERELKAVIAVVLSLVVARLVLDLVGGLVFSFGTIPSAVVLPLAGIFGLAIGVISGAVGVAGGEYRIPILIFLFGLGIKVAGTASQFVSLPTIIVALYKHRGMGFVSRRSLKIAAAMGAGSVVGAAAGTLILVSSSESAIEVVFAVLIIYTILRLVMEIWKK